MNEDLNSAATHARPISKRNWRLWKLNRRGALWSLLSAAAVMLGCRGPHERRRGANRRQEPYGPADSSTDAVDKLLDRDLKALTGRPYSEEGIPVFLVCEDLTPGGRSSRVLPGPAQDDRLRLQFRTNAAAWPRIRPEATADDLGKLIEIVAERDFGMLQRNKTP